MAEFEAPFKLIVQKTAEDGRARDPLARPAGGHCLLLLLLLHPHPSSILTLQKAPASIMTLVDDDLQRLWSLVADLSAQLSSNKELCASLIQHVDELKVSELLSSFSFLSGRRIYPC